MVRAENMPAELPPLARFIRQQRKEKMITQAELGDWCGVSVQAVQNWEKGKKMPKYERAKAIAEMFGVTFDHPAFEEYRLIVNGNNIAVKSLKLKKERPSNGQRKLSAFARVLQRLRTATGLTQRELAARIGVSESAIGTWETSHSTPTARSARKIYAFFANNLERLECQDIVLVLRKANRRTQEELSIGAGLSRGYAGKIETGAHIPDTKTCNKISAFFGIDARILAAAAKAAREAAAKEEAEKENAEKDKAEDTATASKPKVSVDDYLLAQIGTGMSAKKAADDLSDYIWDLYDLAKRGLLRSPTPFNKYWLPANA